MLQKLHEVESAKVKQWLDHGDAILIDVREAAEFNQEYIPQARLYPISEFNPQAVKSGDGKKMIFHCKAGRRSVTAATKWADYYGAPDAYVLKGGIDAWKKEGFATHSDQAGSRENQKKVLFIAGALVLAGTALAGFFSSWFLIIPGLAGVLLIAAGAADNSYLAYMLSRFQRKK